MLPPVKDYEISPAALKALIDSDDDSEFRLIDCREEVVGIITRKDILAETIEERMAPRLRACCSSICGTCRQVIM